MAKIIRLSEIRTLVKEILKEDVSMIKENNNGFNEVEKELSDAIDQILYRKNDSYLNREQMLNKTKTPQEMADRVDEVIKYFKYMIWSLDNNEFKMFAKQRKNNNI
jgi:hypothetical protein